MTRFFLPNFVLAEICGQTLSEKQDWWDCFSSMNSLPFDNVIFWDDGLIYDFCPPGEGNMWFFINHSKVKFNVMPVWTGRNLIFRAVKPIKKRQEILFCYNTQWCAPQEWQS